METSRFIQLRKIFDEAVLLPATEWEAYLAGNCGGDERLQAEVRELLLAYQQGEASAPTAGSQPGSPARMIGPYRILRELGAGGMGVVHLAVRDDGTFRKNVAVKLLKRAHASQDLIQRFHQERQVLANLDHPNIARILDGGQTIDGLPYLVMEYVEGLALDSFCDTQRLDLADRIRLFQQLVSAVSYLHEHLIVHRDLKNSNILVTGEGAVKLLDFGIAKIQMPISGSPDLTGPTGRLLTPNYASPEQIAGAPVSKASDIYSLGVILYQLLTGRLPYADAGSKLSAEPPLPSANIREDLQRMPETTSQLRRRIVGDLDQIVLLCLRRDPRHRYASASALGEDLHRFLDGRSVIARKEPIIQRTLRFLRRNRAAVAVAALLLVSCGIGAWKTVQAQNQARQIEASEAALKHVLDTLDQRSAAVASSQTESTPRVDDLRKLRHALAQEAGPIVSGQSVLTPQRQALFERAAKYLDSVRGNVAQNAALAAELAAAYTELGVLYPTSYRSYAIAAYRNAALVLQKATGGDPEHSPYNEQWALVVTRIRGLGGSVPVYEIASPVARLVLATPPVKKNEGPVEPGDSNTPDVEAIPVVALPAPVVVDPAQYQMAKSKLNLAVTRAKAADETMEQIRADSAKLGQIPNLEITSLYNRMHNALDSAKGDLENGNLAGALSNIDIASACASRVQKAIGR